jgi:hypothetical protein
MPCIQKEINQLCETLREFNLKYLTFMPPDLLDQWNLNSNLIHSSPSEYFLVKSGSLLKRLDCRVEEEAIYMVMYAFFLKGIFQA